MGTKNRSSLCALAKWLVAAPIACFLGFGAVAQGTPPASPFDWSSLPTNTWTKLATRGAAPPKIFHGGMTLDTDRGLLLVFGSDSHEEPRNYDNSVYRLDLKSLAWSRDYPPDGLSTYVRVGDRLRTTAGRPWADHVFDAIDYFPPLKKMVVVQYPMHAYLFAPLILDAKPTTWLYDPDTRQWEALTTSAPNLFAASSVFDPDTGSLIGYGDFHTYLFDEKTAEWRSYALAGGPAGYHFSMQYDAMLKRVLAYGNQAAADDLYALDVAALKWEKIITRTKAPGVVGAAIAYSVKAQALILLASKAADRYSNTTGESETWIFDSKAKDWHRLYIDSPPLYGMSYHHVYDMERDVFLFGEGDGGPEGPLAVWGLRYVAPD